MNCSLNSLKEGYIGDYIGDYIIGAIKGDTRSLDYGSYGVYIVMYVWLVLEICTEVHIRFRDCKAQDL